MISAPDNFQDEVELGYSFARDFWGLGLAAEISKAVLAVGFGSRRLPDVIAFTPVGHRASRHVMEKLGFQHDCGREIKDALCAVYRLRTPVKMA